MLFGCPDAVSGVSRGKKGGTLNFVSMRNVIQNTSINAPSRIFKISIYFQNISKSDIDPDDNV